MPILALTAVCAVLAVLVAMVLLDLLRGRTRWQVRQRLVRAARARIIERVGRTPEDLTRDRAVVLGCSRRQVDRLPPEVLGARLRQLMISRGASPMQAYYLRSPSTEDFLTGRAPLPPVEDLARDALLEHLISDGIALPHDSEYLAAKARLSLDDWTALPYPTQQQATARLFDLTTELPRTMEDVDRHWQGVFLRGGLALQEWRSIDVRERRRQAETYLDTHPGLVSLELTRLAQELERMHQPVN